MVVPLIIGAAKVARTKKTLQKTRKETGKGSSIAQRRAERMYTKEAIHNRPRKKHPSADEKSEENVRRVRDILPYRKALQNTENEKGSTKTVLKKAKATSRGIITLGTVFFPMALQPIFALLALLSLAFDDSWWGWVDIVDLALTMASIFWLIALMLGTYTMLIAVFMMSKYLHDWKVVLAFMFCFSANWVPFIQIVPWVSVWILFIILNEK